MGIEHRIRQTGIMGIEFGDNLFFSRHGFMRSSKTSTNDSQHFGVIEFGLHREIMACVFSVKHPLSFRSAISTQFCDAPRALVVLMSSYSVKRLFCLRLDHLNRASKLYLLRHPMSEQIEQKSGNFVKNSLEI